MEGWGWDAPGPQPAGQVEGNRGGEAGEGEREDFENTAALSLGRKAWRKCRAGKQRGLESINRKEDETEAGRGGFCGLEGTRDTWVERAPQGPLVTLMCPSHTPTPQGHFRLRFSDTQVSSDPRP